MNLLISLITTFLSLSVFASSKVLVTAEKINLELNNTNTNVQVITEKEIVESGETHLTDLIQRESSVFVNSNGTFGKSSSLFLRGADSSYTLIIIDGIEYNDRSTVGGAAILDHIDLGSVEQIEILNGAQSVLYGSDALAGVIKITTKGPGYNVGSSGELHYGSFDNKVARFNTSQKGELFDYTMGVSFQDVEGISSYSDKRVAMAEKDGMNNLSANIRGVRKIGKKDTLEFSLRGVRARTDFDDSTGDKLDYVGRDSQTLAGVNYRRIVNEYWVPEFSLNYNKSDRLSNSGVLSRLVATTKKAQLLNSFYINEKLTLINGLEYEDVNASVGTINNKKNFTSSATYLDSHLVLKKFKFQLGSRWAKEKNFSDRMVWKAGVGITLSKNTKLKGNYSTGFKSPSLYQLYSTFGNEDLSATKSKSYDFGIFQEFLGNTVCAVFFRDNYDNIVDFDSTLNKYKNTAQAQSEGIEFSWKGASAKFDWSSSMTLLRAKSLAPASKGQYLARRPREKYFMALGYKLSDKVKTKLSYSYVGERENSDYDDIVLSSYSLVDLDLSYEFSRDQNILLKLKNILDKDYEQVYGFGTMGRNFLLRYQFRI